MKLEKMLRIVLKVIYCEIFALIIILNHFGIFSALKYILIGIHIGITIIQIIYSLYKRLMYKKMFDLYVKVYRNLKSAHNKRYRYYFEGNEEGIDKCTELVNESANAILYSSEIIIRSKFGKKKEREIAKDILDKTKVLITTIQPPYNKRRF